MSPLDLSEANWCLGPGSVTYRRGMLVRLEDQWRNCTVVIGSAEPGSDSDILPWCTGFLVDADVGGSGGKYLVTAAHAVLDKQDCPVDIRFNRRGGGAGIHSIDRPEWFTHPTDDTVDVAVHEIAIPEWADAALIPRKTVMAADKLKSKNIGAGDRTYTVGLWKFMVGDGRNQPFVYTGHIGLLPDGQRVPVRRWASTHRSDKVLVEAYLAEGEPLDGVSGAPVFVRRTIETRQGKTLAYLEGSVWLLGMHSDSWFGPASMDYQMPPGAKGRPIPRGVNVVVPSMKINEVLNHPELQRRRDDAKRARDNAMLPDKASGK